MVKNYKNTKIKHERYKKDCYILKFNTQNCNIVEIHCVQIRINMKSWLSFFTLNLFFSICVYLYLYFRRIPAESI
jgi:hypothetical protein